MQVPSTRCTVYSTLEVIMLVVEVVLTTAKSARCHMHAITSGAPYARTDAEAVGLHLTAMKQRQTYSVIAADSINNIRSDRENG